MNIKINLPENNNIADLRAKLILESIKKQEVSNEKKNLILKEIIKILTKDEVR